MSELSHLERWQLAKELVASHPMHNPNHISDVYYWLKAANDRRDVVAAALDYEAVGGSPMMLIAVWQTEGR